MTSILEVNNLTKTYDQFSLDRLSFSLQKGCITGFIGVNGAGKTTTIKSILGLINPEAGSIRFDGMEMNRQEKQIKNRIGFVLDEGYFYGMLTVKEMKNVIAPAYSSWDEQTFSNWIGRFGLNPNQKIASLSTGMRMKFAVALALSHHADLLIMDEPTSGLDPMMRSELMAILLDFMKEEGKSVFFSTHITSDLDKVADMLILIDGGKILLNEEKDTLLDNHARIKGDSRWINERTRPLFLTLRETPYGFEGLTHQKEALRQEMPDAVFERPTIEDIMLAYVGGAEIAH
ncbi:ABC transporter ATP-binding protein [Sporolactobacillus vineae]|uniref:ABC transporter ATP-binding protein n=1 Tax=Sporolactobacillus vineae TaxID=444463 RepID=UPI000289AC9F|nr:ABC transporter ATP-binding protein [Sporolactobacillus vineae]